MTQGVDGGPGLSGLVVHTSTSLGLLFPSMFDAMSCRDGNGQHGGLKGGQCKVNKRKWKERRGKQRGQKGSIHRKYGMVRERNGGNNRVKEETK